MERWSNIKDVFTSELQNSSSPLLHYSGFNSSFSCKKFINNYVILKLPIVFDLRNYNICRSLIINFERHIIWIT